MGYSEDLNSYWGVIGGGLRTGEGCSTTDINIRHGLLQIIRQRIILAKDNREWANMCSLIGVSFGQRPCLWERQCIQYYTAEPEHNIWNLGQFLHLANLLVEWVGVTELLL